MVSAKVRRQLSRETVNDLSPASVELGEMRRGNALRSILVKIIMLQREKMLSLSLSPSLSLGAAAILEER